MEEQKIEQPAEISQPVPQIAPKSEEKTLQKENDNVIFIGDKPIINYVRSISVQLSKQNSSEVIVRSRGRFISRAVDIVEIAKRKFLEKEGVKIKEIKISSEEFEKEGKKLNVSTMDIVLNKV